MNLHKKFGGIPEEFAKYDKSKIVLIPVPFDINIKGLFPCGEGGGYAGGIVSAAMDGERCAEAAIKILE